MKDVFFSLQVLIKQEGSCDTPITVICDYCALLDFCINEAVITPEVDKTAILKKANEMIKKYTDEIIFDMLL